MSHLGTKLTLQQRERLRVIGIESSCDETGVAVYDSEKGLMADLLYSQIDLHKEYGGVVPELASRDHINYIIPLIQDLLKDCKINIQNNFQKELSYEAVGNLYFDKAQFVNAAMTLREQYDIVFYIEPVGVV